MLKINYKENIPKDVLLDISKIEKSDNTILVLCKMNHGLSVDDELQFIKYYYDNGVKIPLVSKLFKIIDIRDEKTIIIDNIGNKELIVVKENPPKSRGRVLTFDRYHNIMPNDLLKYEMSVEKPFITCNSGTSEQSLITNIAHVDRYTNKYYVDDEYVSSELDMSSIYGIMPDIDFNITNRLSFPFNEYYFTLNNVCVLFDNVEIVGKKSYYNLTIPFTMDTDYGRLMQEENIGIFYDNNVRDYVIPEVINMEKVKYKPILVDGNYADGLIFNLHFRARINENDGKEWYIEEDSEKYWNTIKSLSETVNTNPNVYKSDSLWYLGFNDSDILNQKMKLKQSFIRLSFYDSNDPISQKLLFYSTIFIDTGSLYGKYLKYMKEARRNGKTFTLESDKDGNNELNCQFSVFDEYQTIKSSEGFNLYLFEDDAPLKNEEKDIYLKVEFNHAKYGRTIPMVLWNMDNPTNGLTMDNLYDCLYIKVKLSYTDNGYKYSIPDIETRDNNLIFNLFEPRLEKRKD